MFSESFFFFFSSLLLLLNNAEAFSGVSLMNCKVSLNVTAVRTGDNVAHESPVLCNLLLRKSPLTSVLCLWELFPACQASHPKSFAPYRRVMMQSFWGLYRCLVGGKKTT